MPIGLSNRVRITQARHAKEATAQSHEDENEDIEWESLSEDSDGPDYEMLEELIILLQSFANINPNKIRIEFG